MESSFYLTNTQYYLFKEYLDKVKTVIVSEKSIEHNMVYITVMGESQELVKINDYYKNLTQ